jgi:hypothetical protein
MSAFHKVATRKTVCGNDWNPPTSDLGMRRDFRECQCFPFRQWVTLCVRYDRNTIPAQLVYARVDLLAYCAGCSVKRRPEAALAGRDQRLRLRRLSGLGARPRRDGSWVFPLRAEGPYPRSDQGGCHAGSYGQPRQDSRRTRSPAIVCVYDGLRLSPARFVTLQEFPVCALRKRRRVVRQFSRCSTKHNDGGVSSYIVGVG